MIDKQEMESRVLNITKFIIDTKSTVRATAKQFGVSKTTVYRYVTERILEINPSLAKEVEKVLIYNKKQRYLRGAEATRKKWLEIRSTS